MMNFLEVYNAGRRRDDKWIVENISFRQLPLQKTGIAGETGSGKTTLLKMIAGLMQPDAGEIKFLNQHVEGPDEKLIPGHTGIACLSQQFELPKFLRVEQVLAYANKMDPDTTNNLYEICRITHLMHRRTNELSGGEQQRIALARLLVGAPRLLLLDEPFSNLDMIHKSILKTVLQNAADRLQLTCLMASHDPQDLLAWADELLLMQEGKIIQQGPPQALYYQPVSEYAGALLGKYNLLTPELTTAFLQVCGIEKKGKQLFVRPEQFIISHQPDKGLRGIITEIRFAGSSREATIEIPHHSTLLVSTRNHYLQAGAEVFVSIHIENSWYL